MELPTIDDATDKATQTARNARNAVKSRISILPDNETCEKCGAVMEASTAADPQEGAFFDEYVGNERPTWYCSECDTHFRREREDSDVTFSAWD